MSRVARRVEWRIGIMLLLATIAATGYAQSATQQRLGRAIADFQTRYGGRVGVAVIDSARPGLDAVAGDTRFPICSTFKVLAAAGLLARVDAGRERLTRRVRYGQRDLVVYSPVTARHVDDGLTLAAIARAAVERSDNTAANLLLDAVGGPAGLTHFLRGLGDNTTRIDGHEPLCRAFDTVSVRNTTTPRAMAITLQRLLIGPALSPASRRRLRGWMISSRTGASRLRAGLPAGWRVGDKTGSGLHATANDVAIVWPPRGAAWLIAAYSTGSRGDARTRNAMLAGLAHIAATAAPSQHP